MTLGTPIGATARSRTGRAGIGRGVRRGTAVVGLCLLLAGSGASPAAAHTIRTVQSSTCKAKWRTLAGNEQQIRCFASFFGVSPDTAASIAKCESGFDYRAYNPAGPYHGTWQYLSSTFESEKDHFLPRNPKASPYHGRLATIRTMRHVHHHGWGAWGCA